MWLLVLIVVLLIVVVGLDLEEYRADNKKRARDKERALFNHENPEFKVCSCDHPLYGHGFLGCVWCSCKLIGDGAGFPRQRDPLQRVELDVE